MLRYTTAAVVCGLLFGTMDAVINANPIAIDLASIYAPIARQEIQVTAGIVIDLLYGFVLAGLFLVLFPSLPGHNRWTKGLSFGAIAWFFRVLMSVASEWMVLEVPGKLLVYKTVTGMIEMMLLGIVLAALLKPTGSSRRQKLNNHGVPEMGES